MEKELQNIEDCLSYLSEIEEIIFDVLSDRLTIPDIDYENEVENQEDEENDEAISEFDEDCYKAKIEEEINEQKEAELENARWDFHLLFESLSKIIESTNIGIYDKLEDEASWIFYILDKDDEDIEHRLNELKINSLKITQVLETLLLKINQEQFYESPKILSPNLISDLNEEVLNLFAKYPELIYKINPRLFEKLIAEVFRKFKLDITLTKATRDGGFDIIALEDNYYTKNKYIIECKRYDKSNKVGINIVQRLYGIKQDLRVSKAMLVTSSYFSKDALEFAKQHIWEIELKDYNDITKWLKMFWS